MPAARALHARGCACVRNPGGPLSLSEVCTEIRATARRTCEGAVGLFTGRCVEGVQAWWWSAHRDHGREKTLRAAGLEGGGEGGMGEMLAKEEIARAAGAGSTRLEYNLMAPSDKKINCRHCGTAWNSRGIRTHEAACGAKKSNQAKNAAFIAEFKAKKRQVASAQLNTQALLQGKVFVPSALHAINSLEEDESNQPLAGPSSLRAEIPKRNNVLDYLDSDFPEDDASTEGTNDFDPQQENPPPAEDIKRIFHPHSKHQVYFGSFDAYLKSNMAERPVPADAEPWRPFRSRLDFEVAEFCEQSMLNKDFTETLISLIRRCMFNPDDFTLTSQRELDELWDLASHKCTAFEKGSVTIQYKNEDKSFDTYTRPLWDWARSLIQDPRLASCFVWDAEKVYKFNGESYVRFYHEPWTADAFWAAQSGLPDDPAAKPVCFVLYADKSKLSSFGTQKAYAVIARLANLPTTIRNSIQFGGGQLVGHQPVVKDDPQENSKPAFSNFKNIVWHTAFYKLLESLAHASRVGDWTSCGDAILRWLWPRILILAADYEEACVMALIRGLQGLYPCPICFVPWNEQSDLSTEHPLRTGKESEEILENARALRTAAEREELLKDHGLRDVENTFWKIKDSDPHAAISYDPLHADDGGFWGDHLFTQIKARVTELGRAAIVKIDAQMAMFPRWRGLNHFGTVMNTSFNDGSKHEDIAKMMLFVAHNVLVDDAGLLLLQALRSYLEYRTLLSFEVHTSETIAAGRREVLNLDSVMKEYITACEGTEHGEKNWNFPKFHARRHAFDDIKNKGASRNFGTKTSESMHGTIRQTYHRLTNFKDIEALDENPDDSGENPEDLEATILSNVDIGSKLQPVTFSTLEKDMSADPAFKRFRVKFGNFISVFLQEFNHGLPNQKWLAFSDTDSACALFCFRSWLTVASPDCAFSIPQGRPRYDCVLVETVDGPIFAQLVYVFSWMVEKKVHPFALILPFDPPTGRLKKKDKALRFHRVKAKEKTDTEFISVHSIIRGAVLVPDFDNPGEFIVFDVLDTDMSRRVKSLYPARWDSIS
ncbi:hypothetical protein DFH09DRAFT_1293679 [Mycena vulgaris]|nr:hypothetical protein DFH09DRAFT_1293679 [Mycena vulgaris]